LFQHCGIPPFKENVLSQEGTCTLYSVQCTQYSNEDEEYVIAEFQPYGNTQFQPNGIAERQPSGIAQIDQGNLYNQQMIIYLFYCLPGFLGDL
jgi:hypothetical protein